MFALVFLELRTLYLDRDEHDNEQALARCQQLQSFKEIANTLSTAISTNQEHFDATMKGVEKVFGKTEEAADTATQAVNTITGGDNILVMSITNGFLNSGPPFVFSPTKRIVRGVTARVVNLEDFATYRTPTTLDEFSRGSTIYEVGDVGSGVGKLLSPALKITSGKSASFNIFFSGLNGFWDENLRMRWKDGKWLEAIKVTRLYHDINRKDKRPAYEVIPPGFLEQNETFDWNATAK